MAKDGASDANEQDETEIHDPAKAHADDEFDSLDEEAADEEDARDDSEESDDDTSDEESDEDAEDLATVTATDVDATPWASIEIDDTPQAVTDSSEIAKPLIAAPEALLTPAVNFQSELPIEETSEEPEAAADDGDAIPASPADTRSDPQVEPASVLKVAQAPAIAVVPAAVASRGGWWTIPTLCSGLAIVACSLIIPQTDANRRLAWERQMLELDFESVTRQVEVNDQFLSHVANDPNLAERLAQRQMKVYRQGTAVLDLKRSAKEEMSPFLLTAVVPPDPLPPYQSRSGRLAQIFLNPRHGLYASGLGLLLVATGLIMGGTPMKPRRTAE